MANLGRKKAEYSAGKSDIKKSEHSARNSWLFSKEAAALHSPVEVGSASGMKSSSSQTTGTDTTPSTASVANIIPIVDDDYPYTCKCVQASRSHRHGMASLADTSQAHCLNDELTRCVPLDFAGRDHLMAVVLLVVYLFG